MKKMIAFMFCLALLTACFAPVMAESGEEWICPACEAAMSGNFCSDCGERATFLHNWDDGVVTKFPTKSTDGAMKYTCQICGEAYTVPVAYGDYLPPFPEVSELTYEGSLVTVRLSEFSGDAGNVLLTVAAYDGAGKLLRAAAGKPAKTGVFAAELVQGAKQIRVFIVEEASLIPLTAPYVQNFG